MQVKKDLPVGNASTETFQEIATTDVPVMNAW
jgi:hypothetical protein